RKICEDYARRFPDKIRLLARERNLGMCSNFVETILACRGDFIAFCDGDDYWIDPKKLQIQAGLLSKNPEIVLCVNADRVEEIDGS
ncbi:glycosyltransferase, partial [Escherichia coli]|nr:glycosyltransferase [Escherichia coli]